CASGPSGPGQPDRHGPSARPSLPPLGLGLSVPQMTLASRRPPSDAAAMDATMTRVDAVAATLPAGYRGRGFRDSDRAPWPEERNAQVHELQRSTAEEWREWERIE